MEKTKKKIQFKKIEIQIGDIVTKLTLDEVQELRDILNDAFPVSTEKEVTEEVHFWPYQRWDYVPYPGLPQTWYSSSGDTTDIDLGYVSTSGDTFCISLNK